MPTITFSNGVKVKFNGNPTKQDIEEMATKLGINQQPQQPQPDNRNIIQKFADASGKALGTASNFLFGNANKTIGTAIAAPILELQGKHDQAQKLVNENIAPGKIALTGLEMYPGGGTVTNLAKKIPGVGPAIEAVATKVPAALKSSAVKQYSEALGATTNELKAKTAKVVPELLKRGEKVLGLERFADKTANLVDEAGKAVKKAENALPVFAKQKTAPLVEKAAKLRNQFIVNGKVLDEGAVKAIDNVVESITQYGKEIPETQLVKIRRVLDKSVAIANKNFTKDEGLSLAAEAKQGIANSIRSVLNSNNPKLAAANKEFTLWSDVNKIVNKTLERRSTQSGGLTKFIAPIVAGGGGFAASGDMVSAIAGFFGTQAAIKLFQSPAYKTISAIQKNKLADYLASGKINDAILLTTKLLNGINNETKR